MTTKIKLHQKIIRYLIVIPIYLIVLIGITIVVSVLTIGSLPWCVFSLAKYGYVDLETPIYEDYVSFIKNGWKIYE